MCIPASTLNDACNALSNGTRGIRSGGRLRLIDEVGSLS
jgi:hypothetical protein